ncbi:DUF2971 domain-containing protein [uncultured Pseudoteredinibacter sp.]|uniref:DUF2971 domain-containing protein n=1 Tax=uncultured Pseudoteredinibacter sp. TaxID=1641701 RepID=UPI0026225C02|nr:DUF2971 domain-containing protein [uncultured Pseudoteredinibacter sp.]
MALNQENLIKFCSAGCAGRVLNNQELRWSAPSLFDDIFELSSSSQLTFTHGELLKATIQMASSMIFAKDDPKGVSPLAKAIRRWRDEERFDTPEEAEEVLSELLVQMVDQRYNEIQTIIQDWREYSRSVRICSFSAKAENMSAWEHYGAAHTGAALKFRGSDHDDSDFNYPEKVNYKGICPEITTLKQQLNNIVTANAEDHKDEFRGKLLQKAPHQKDVAEWRCFRYQETEKNSDPKTWFEDVHFETEDLAAVYFGAFMDEKAKDVLMRLLQKRYRRTKIFQAKIVTGKFELEFERIMTV